MSKEDIFEISRVKKKKKVVAKKDANEEYKDEEKQKQGIKKLKLKKKDLTKVEEPEKAKKKKKSVIKEPKEIRTAKALTKVKKKLEKQRSRVEGEEGELAKIVKKVEELSANDPNGYLNVYLDMFDKQRKIIKKTEKKILSRRSKCTGKEIYHLSTMYSQLRETIADLRSISDLSEHAERIIAQAVQPVFTLILQSMSDSMHEVKVRIRDKLTEKDVKKTFDKIDETTIDLGRKMQVHYEKITSDIRSLLLE